MRYVSLSVENTRRRVSKKRKAPRCEWLNVKQITIMAKYNCCKCGNSVDSSKYVNYREMESRHLCLHCNFWQNHVDNDATVIVIANGEHYIIGDENSTDYFRGFGGAKVTIKFNDGRVVKSSNLWYQGDIPERFRNEMPDNAEIVWGWED